MQVRTLLPHRLSVKDNGFRHKEDEAWFDSYFQGRPVALERPIDTPELEEDPFYLRVMRGRHGWIHALSQRRVANVSMVREFCAGLRSCPADYSFETYLRGSAIDLTPAKMAIVFDIQEVVDYQCPFAQDASSPTKDEVAAELMRAEGSVWPDKKIPKKDLKDHYRILFLVVASAIIPTSFKAEVDWDYARIIFAIGTGMRIDLTRLLIDYIVRSSTQTSHKIALRCAGLITELCRYAGVVRRDDDEEQQPLGPIGESSCRRSSGQFVGHAKRAPVSTSDEEAPERDEEFSHSLSAEHRRKASDHCPSEPMQDKLDHILEQQRALVSHADHIEKQQQRHNDQIEQQQLRFDNIDQQQNEMMVLLQGFFHRFPPSTPMPHPQHFVSEDTNVITPMNETPMAPASIPLSFPGNITTEWIQMLMSIFYWSSRNLSPCDFPFVLPVSVLTSLVLSATKILQAEANCISVDHCGPDCRVVVVGDLHGQLHDILFLLQDAGYPSDDCIYVFNGDYVDGGAWGLETFILLLVWKLHIPHGVFLLRGNHESKYCTTTYGFKNEVMIKYGQHGKQVYKSILKCFASLPLATIIAGCVYTTHGGLFRSVAVNNSKKNRAKKKKLDLEESYLCLGSLEELSRVKRSFIDPPCEGLHTTLGDVLWSDPSMSPGLSHNYERGTGLLWGPDCTEDFLKKSNLKLIIRSHEGPDARQDRSGLSGMGEGYSIDHVVESGKLITLFSAPDYPQFQETKDRNTNKGAYIVLEPPDFHVPKFHTFEAIPRPKVKPYYDCECVMEDDVEQASPFSAFKKHSQGQS